jgi:predicted DNA-binding WGR domain protein
MTILKTSLWYIGGTSDKVYHATLDRNADGNYVLNAQWGRRGKSLQSQTKGVYINQWDATREFHNLVSSKTNKGYRVTERAAV